MFGGRVAFTTKKDAKYFLKSSYLFLQKFKFLFFHDFLFKSFLGSPSELVREE